MLAGASVACACGALAAGAARATPPHGVTNTLIAGPVEIGDIDALTNDAPDYKARVRTRGASDTYVQYTAIAPGGDVGWHSHPGIVFVLVVSGTATHVDEDFTPTDFPAGSGFVEEPGNVHNLVNEGDTDLELVVFFLLPKGAPRRIDEPMPSP